MTNPSGGPREDDRDPGALRERAESRIGDLEATEGPRTRRDSDSLVHELRVHQVELEMQNDELQRVQLALELSRAKYFDLYDLAPVGYVTMDDDGLILESNLRTSTMLLTPRAELRGMPMTQFVAPVDQDTYHLNARRVRPGAPPVVLELQMRRRDGAVFWARLEMSTGDRHHGASTIRATLSDVSEIRKMREDKELADRIVSIGVMTASVAHEINNPLTYLLYHAEGLVEDLARLGEAVACCREALQGAVGAGAADLVGERWRELQPAAIAQTLARAEQAAEGTRHIAAVSRRLAYFATSDPEGLTLVDVNDAARHAIGMASLEIKKRATLVQELSPVPRILGSKGRLAQVFLNLLLNAAHAIDEGRVRDNRIVVRTWTDATGQVFASVRDTGCGIRPENLDQLFQPFFTTGASGTGMGLGMAITKRIVAAFGADIGVHSVVGRGTRVELRFPAAATKTPLPAERTEAPPTVSGRVLVIDDEAPVRAVLSGMVGSQHEVVAVGSATEAMDLLSTDARFDALVCDLLMPRLTGMDLHLWLRQHHPRLAERVIFVSGGVYTPNARRYLASVSNRCLMKPHELGMLRELVRQEVTRVA